jgi:hypothetical protein
MVRTRLEEKYPHLLEFAFKELNDNQPPLVKHFNQKGIHQFVSKMVAFLLLQFCVDFVGVFFFESPPNPKLVFGMSSVSMFAILLAARFKLSVLQIAPIFVFGLYTLSQACSLVALNSILKPISSTESNFLTM